MPLISEDVQLGSHPGELQLGKSELPVTLLPLHYHTHTPPPRGNDSLIKRKKYTAVSQHHFYHQNFRSSLAPISHHNRHWGLHVCPQQRDGWSRLKQLAKITASALPPRSPSSLLPFLLRRIPQGSCRASISQHRGGSERLLYFPRETQPLSGRAKICQFPANAEVLASSSSNTLWHSCHGSKQRRKR